MYSCSRYCSHQLLLLSGRSHFYFPLSFITSGTLSADTLVVRKKTGKKVPIRFFSLFLALTLGFPLLTSFLEDVSFRVAAGNKPKTQVETIEANGSILLVDTSVILAHLYCCSVYSYILTVIVYSFLAIISIKCYIFNVDTNVIIFKSNLIFSVYCL